MNKSLKLSWNRGEKIEENYFWVDYLFILLLFFIKENRLVWFYKRLDCPIITGPGYLHTVIAFNWIIFSSISSYFPTAHSAMYGTECTVSDNDRCYFTSALSITALSTLAM